MKQAQAEVRNPSSDFSQILKQADQPSASSLTFLEIAVPLAERGIPVIPVEPLEKRCLLPDWQRRATTDLEQIARWDAENPNYNVGCVAKPEGIVVLDCDVKGLMRRIEEETGQKFPSTLVVRSAGKGCAHVYFLQTELSRKLGNRKAAGLFDLQSADKYVVGPRSRLDNGRTYEVVKGAPIAPFPDWLYGWVLAHADQPKKAEGKDARTVDDEFDFEDFCDWYGISGDWDGEWFITDVCPVAGYRHEQSTRTGFYFDGGTLGFHCFASGCAGSGMTVGQVIKFLNQTHEPYKGVIWEEEPIGELLGEFGVEAAAVQPAGDAEEDADGQATTLLSEEAPVPPPAPAAVSPPIPEMGTASAATAAAPARDPLAFPEQFMYGEAGVLAEQMRMPLGLAYIALIGEYSAKCDVDVMCGTRINTYTVLIAAVGGGKNQAMDRAQRTLGLIRGTEYVKGAPAGGGRS